MMSELGLRVIAMLALVSATAGPLGALMIWRRMSYFADAFSHGALFGVALALWLQIPGFWGAIVSAVLIALIFARVDLRHGYPDALLGVIAYGGLALALIVSQMTGSGAAMLEGFLFGELLLTQTADLWQGLFVAALILGVLAWRWNPLLLVTINPELASAQGISPQRETRIFVLLLALTVALSIKITGALLIGALLILPPLTAARWAKSPETMVISASLTAFIAACVGVFFSFQWDWPAGPSIVVACLVAYLGAIALRRD